MRTSAQRPLARVCALALILAIALAPAAAAVSPSQGYYKVNSAFECAVYINSRMSGGFASVQIETPADVGDSYFYEVYSLLRMIYADYCSLEYSWYMNRRQWSINITMQGVESGRIEAEARARKVIADIIKPSMSQVEKLAVIHDYVINNCEYDYSVEDDMNSAPRAAFSAYGMLVLGKGVCDAYSAAFALLCKYAGIPCLYLLSAEMVHSWNAVLLGGQIFFVDSTYNDTGDTSNPREYFLLTPKQLSDKGHKWDDRLLRTATDSLWDSRFQAANNLSALGLFRGTDAGFELSRTPTRAEGSIMLLRLMGLENTAAQQGASLDSPFTDVSGFYSPYISYMRDAGLTQGTSATTFSPELDIGLQQYLSFVLRALGYDDRAGDFEWTRALDAAVSLGVLSKSDAATVASARFDRGVMAFISMRALYANTKSGVRLADELIGRGIFSRALLTEIEKYS